MKVSTIKTKPTDGSDPTVIGAVVEIYDIEELSKSKNLKYFKEYPYKYTILDGKIEICTVMWKDECRWITKKSRKRFDVDDLIVINNAFKKLFPNKCDTCNFCPG